jgi:hypothetical protein
MAMTVTKPADNTETVYDDVWLSAISSASGQTDLKYVIELYDGTSKIFEAKVVPEPSNKYMYFNVAPIIRNRITEYFAGANAYDFSNAKLLNNSKSLGYRIGSDYSGITTLNEASGNCAVKIFRPKLLNRRYLRKTISNDTLNRWQTDRKLEGSLTNNSDNFFIAFQGDLSGGTTADFWEVGFEEYNAAGTQISSDSGTVLGGTSQPAQLNVGPDSLQQLIGSKPNLNTCAYYIATVSWDNGNEELRFRINKHCENKYQSVPIHFLNRFHCYDTMRFNLVSRTTVDVERKSYNQRDYRFSGSSVLYTDASATGKTVYRENKINYNATYNYTMKLTSDLLDDQDWEWLEDLIESPKIYMEEDGYFYPVTIKATNYEISKYINNRQRPLEIEIEFNSPRLSSAR